MNKNKIFLALMLIVIASIAFFVIKSFSSDSEPKLSGLDELIRIDDIINKEVFGGNSPSDESIREGIKYLNDFLPLYRKEVENHIRLSNRVDVDDSEAVLELLSRHDKIIKIKDSANICTSFELSYLEIVLKEEGIRESVIRNFIRKLEQRCEISEQLDVVSVNRSREETIKASDDFIEVESDAVPVGYSFVAQRPTDGKRRVVTIVVDGNERGPVEVITEVPLIGKRVVGKGSEEQIISQVIPVLNEILALWNTQTFNRENLSKLLHNGEEDVLSKLEEDYQGVIFNWMRFTDVEPIKDNVSFKEVSRDSSFVMSIPISVENVQARTDTSIPFYYEHNTDSWRVDEETFKALFSITGRQYLKGSHTPEVLSFFEQPDCKVENLSIQGLQIEGRNRLVVTSQGTISNIFIRVPGRDTLSELNNRLFSDEIIELINSKRVNSITIAEMQHSVYVSFHIGSSKCKTAEDLVVNFD